MVIIMMMLVNSSCGQSINSNNVAQAQTLVNQAGALMMSASAGEEEKVTLNKAVDLLKKSIELNDTVNVAAQSLIICYIRLKEPQKAINVCTQWLKKFPKDQNARLQRGMLYYSLKNFDLADDDFDVIKAYIVKQNPTFSSNLAPAEIDKIINLSFLSVVVGNQEHAIYLIDHLKTALPKNTIVDRAYVDMQKTTRDDVIKKFTGF